MLTIKNLTKSYGKTLANDSLNLSASPGEISVLLGPNGAGKSTVIKCVAGLLRFKGEIEVCGYPVKDERAKRALGFVPEVPALYELMSPAEHFEFISRAYAVEDWKNRASELSARFELDEHLDKMGRELSKGMQQKVSIVCALIPRPSVLLLDEPMVGLDPHAIRELSALLLEMRDSGTAILISTHILSSVDEMWDKTFIMHKGKIAAQRARRDASESGETLEELFFRITESEGGAKEALA